MSIKRTIKTRFPNGFRAVKNVLGKLHLGEINDMVLAEHRSTIAAGPFRGMRYIDRASGSALAPKILGTYERELHDVITRIASAPYEVVIDVGAAEGYYAVGLALKLPKAHVYAYDIDERARANLRQLMAENGVSARVSVGMECGYDDFQKFAGQQCLVVCDIEGAEFDLLDPARAPALRGFDILVEIHDGLESSRIHDALAHRFSRSHDLTFIPFEDRNINDAVRARSILRSKNRLAAVDEMRTFGIEWGFFVAKPCTVQGSDASIEAQSASATEARLSDSLAIPSRT